MAKNIWRRILECLPLYAAEGGRYTEADTSFILAKISENDGGDISAEPTLRLTQELLERSGVLDRRRLAEGYWRFVSYPARLYACSLLSLLAEGEPFFRDGFWAPDTNAAVAHQHGVLHTLETLRADTASAPPIRRTFIAWGLVRRCGQFILKRRENPDSDPDNNLHGRYGFPGGRLNLEDFANCGEETSHEELIDFLYGLPKPLTTDMEKIVSSALEHTLFREIEEELGLRPDIHYTASPAPCHRPPATFIHGANAQHCVTECHTLLYDIALTPEGDARLAERCQDSDLFSMDEMFSPWSDERKVFIKGINTEFRDYLENMPDSAQALSIRRSEIEPAESGRKKRDDAITAILPLSHQEPLRLGECEITLPDTRSAGFILLLGLISKTNYPVRIISNGIKRQNWGWVRLDEKLRALANRINRDAAASCGARLLLICGSQCRLRLDDANIFFSPDLFRAEIDRDGITLMRRSLDLPGLLHLDAESCRVDLTPSNREHLDNLRNGNAHLATYDNLRKLRNRGNRRVDEVVREFGLQSLYEPLDDSVSREIQMFRFSIRVD